MGWIEKHSDLALGVIVLLMLALVFMVCQQRGWLDMANFTSSKEEKAELSGDVERGKVEHTNDDSEIDDLIEQINS